MLPTSLHQNVLFIISHYLPADMFAAPISCLLLPACWWLCSFHSCCSPFCFVFLAARQWPFRCQRKENTFSCTESITRQDLISTSSFSWSFFICFLFIRSLYRFLPMPWASALVHEPVFVHLRQSCAMERKLPCTGIQVSVSTSSCLVSCLEWKYFPQGNTLLLTCVFVMPPLLLSDKCSGGQFSCKHKVVL